MSDANETEAAVSAAQAGRISIGDVDVARLGYGAMRITGRGIWGPPRDREAAIRVVRRAVELGVEFIDTADSYGPAVSEELIAEALHPYPPNLILATKGGLVRPGPDRWTPDGRPSHLRAACEASLRRLQVERIDLYQLHSPDPKVPLADSVGALADLQREGKIRHIGLSNVDLGELRAAQAVAAIVSVQNRFNLADREGEDVLDACEAEGLAFVPWYPLSAGRQANGVSRTLARIATTHGAAPTQVAIAWLLARSPAILPIPGTGSTAHIEENVASAGLRLSDAELQELSAT